MGHCAVVLCDRAAQAQAYSEHLAWAATGGLMCLVMSLLLALWMLLWPAAWRIAVGTSWTFVPRSLVH